jgi:hypothetical protein
VSSGTHGAPGYEGSGQAVCILRPFSRTTGRGEASFAGRIPALRLCGSALELAFVAGETALPLPLFRQSASVRSGSTLGSLMRLSL